MNKFKLISISLVILFSFNYSWAKKNSKQNFILTIDPGHGGIFNGCQHNGLKEKDLALDIAKILKSKLLKNHSNIKVKLTRSGDYSLSSDNIKDLEKRSDLVNNNNSNLLVSIHVNSKPQKQIRGFEIYVPHNSKFLVDSYLVACVIHHKFSNLAEANWVGNYKNINGFDRGIRAAKFKIFKNLKCPAVLVELDYLTNPQVNKKFKSKEYKEQLADILYKAIVKYVNNKT